MFSKRQVLSYLVFLTACGGGDGGADPTDPGDGGGDPPDTTRPLVTAISPDDGSWIYDYLVPFWEIAFSEPMDSATAEGQITITGANAVHLAWLSDQALQVFADGLPQGSLADLTVGTGLTDVAGNHLAQPFVASYTIGSEVPVLLDHTPSTGAVDVNRNAMIDLHFSNKMDLATLETGITITDGNQASYPFTVTAIGETRYRLDPVDDLAPTTLTTVTLTTGLFDYSTIALGEEVSFSFTTGEAADSEPPTIVSIDPMSGSTMPADQGQITITFSEPVDESSISPVRVNGQFFWLQNQMPVQPALDASGTVLTYTLPAGLPAGLPLEVVLAGYTDLSGNVQTGETAWSVTVAGQGDPYPVSDGHRYIMVGDWSEGPLGSETPTASDEQWVFYEQAARPTAGQWELREYTWDFAAMEYYDILGVSAGSVDLLGFAELDGSNFVEFFMSSPLTQLKLPLSGGNSWTSSGSVTLPDGTLSATMSGTAVGREDVAAGTLGGIDVTWTDVWRVTRSTTITSGGATIQTGESTFWLAPGIGVIREVYREENFEPGNTGWYKYDNWLRLEQP